MGLTTTTPSTFQPRSFWKRPEGIPGMVLTGMAAVAGLYGLWLALPFLLGIVWGVVNLCIGTAVLAAFAYIAMNKTVQTLLRNIFQSLCRGLANFYTTVDPIGILKNNLDDMRKAKAQLNATIQRFAGSDNNLIQSIARKKQEIQELGAKSQAARRMAAGIGGTDPNSTLKKEQITLQAQTYEEKAGLLMDGVKQLQALEDQTKDMLIKFRHWSQVSDAKIDRTAMRVEIFAEQRQMILDAKGTLSIGQKLLRGDPEQLKLVDGAIAFLQEDAARTLGEIEEFNRFSDKELTDIDIENTAAADRAREKFAEFGVKLEEDAKRPTAADQLQSAVTNAIASPGFPNFNSQPNVGGRMSMPNTGAGSSGDKNYNDLFK